MNALLERVKRALHRGRPETEGQRETARETGVMLGLMREANGPEQTDEQRMMLARALPGMRAREAVLLAIPNRSLVEENELLMIRREMAKIEGRDAPVAAPRIRGLMGEQSLLARFLAACVPLLPYILIGGLVLSVTGWGNSILQGWRADRAEARAERAQDVAEQNYRTAESWRLQANEYREGLIDAANVANQAAAALTAERQRRASAEARERRRNREIANVLAGSPDAPDWRLRDAGEAEGSEPSR